MVAGARLAVIERSGHMVTLERPEAVTGRAGQACGMAREGGPARLHYLSITASWTRRERKP